MGRYGLVARSVSVPARPIFLDTEAQMREGTLLDPGGEPRNRPFVGHSMGISDSDWLLAALYVQWIFSTGFIKSRQSIKSRGATEFDFPLGTCSSS